MQTATVPPIKIDKVVYENFKLVAKHEDTDVSKLIRKFITTYTAQKVKNKSKDLKKSLEKYKYSSDAIDSKDDLDTILY